MRAAEGPWRPPHAAVQPPSIERLAPVIWAAASEQRKTTKAATSSGADEALGRLGGEKHVVDDLLAGQAAGGHGVGDLPLDQRRPDIARADAVDRHARGGQLQGGGLRQAVEPVLGGDVGGLERRGDFGVGRGGRDDPAPAARLHPGDRGAHGVKGGRKVDRQHAVPFIGAERLRWARRTGSRRCSPGCRASPNAASASATMPAISSARSCRPVSGGRGHRRLVLCRRARLQPWLARRSRRG